MSVLETKDLSLQIAGRKVLDKLNLAFSDGCIHALIGPNGAGKTTFASCLMGLSGYVHDHGDILFDGESLTGLPVHERARRGMTMAWQEPARFEGMSVKQFISAGASDRKADSVDEVLEKVGLAPRQYIHRAMDRGLSGGERKRIELASILAMHPRVVLMDEPDSGIDVEALERIFAVLQSLREQGVTVILITHSLQVLKHAEHAFLVCCGRLVDEGKAAEVAEYFQGKCIPCTHENRLA